MSTTHRSAVPVSYRSDLGYVTVTTLAVPVSTPEDEPGRTSGTHYRGALQEQATGGSSGGHIIAESSRVRFTREDAERDAHAMAKTRGYSIAGARA